MLFKTLLVTALATVGIASDIHNFEERQQLVQIVSVSNENSTLRYYPEILTAPVGSLVQFQFHPKNHTVTQSSFAAPCVPLAANLTSLTRPGIRSGFVPVAANASVLPTFTILINDTAPIWIYCGQSPHCEKGMAMVINQNDSTPNTLAAYKAAAAALLNTTASGSTSAVSTAVQPTSAYGGSYTSVYTTTAATSGSVVSAVFTDGNASTVSISSITGSSAASQLSVWMVDGTLTQIVGVLGVVFTAMFAGFLVL